MSTVKVQLMIDNPVNSHWGTNRSLVVHLQYESNTEAKEEIDKLLLQMKMIRESLEIEVENNPRISPPTPTRIQRNPVINASRVVPGNNAVGIIHSTTHHLPTSPHVIAFKVLHSTGEGGPFDTEEIAQQFANTKEGAKIVPIEKN